MTNLDPPERSVVRQHPDRGSHDRQQIMSILDEGMVCHVGFVQDEQPYVIPMNYARDGLRLLLHGAHNSRLVRTLAAGVPICLTVTLVDGLVIGRSAAQYSMNYRSVVVLARAQEIDAHDEKLAALCAFLDHFFPGRGHEIRAVDPHTIEATAVLQVPLLEASAKIRRGPIEEVASSGPAGWAGEIPLRLASLPPVAAPGHAAADAIPPHVAGFRRPGVLRIERNQA